MLIDASYFRLMIACGERGRRATGIEYDVTSKLGEAHRRIEVVEGRVRLLDSCAGKIAQILHRGRGVSPFREANEVGKVRSHRAGTLTANR
jgi:hypothetical protein